MDCKIVGTTYPSNEHFYFKMKNWVNRFIEFLQPNECGEYNFNLFSFILKTKILFNSSFKQTFFTKTR